MIGRGPLRMSHMLSVSVLTAGLVCAGFLTHPSSALAADGMIQPTLAHLVGFDSNGSVTQASTQAATVGEFLQEQGIIPGPHDYVAPALDVPLSDRLIVTYRVAVPVTIARAHELIHVDSAADTVGALLDEQNIRLGSHDEVTPALGSSVPANGIVRIVRVVTWETILRHRIAPSTQRRLDLSLAPAESRVIAHGNAGERDVTIAYTQRDGRTHKSIVGWQIVRRAKPRIVAEGIAQYGVFQRFADRGVDRTAALAANALGMLATAYTAECYGCSGITASGRPAGHGIVAVDPRVIPLGTHLYISGYGFAIAGDTGGAIRGNRIDLGFDSSRDARQFGRREVTVYRLK